jgi:hypothetical protein
MTEFERNAPLFGRTVPVKFSGADGEEEVKQLTVQVLSGSKVRRVPPPAPSASARGVCAPALARHGPAHTARRARALSLSAARLPLARSR